MHATRPIVEEAVRYVIDSQSSEFMVQAFSTGLFSAFAHNPKIAIRDFEGSLSFRRLGGTLEDARMEMRIRAGSLAVMGDMSEKDRKEITERMHDEVLRSDAFPEIVYECLRVAASGNGNLFWAALSGSLTLRGVNRPQPISAKLSLKEGSLRAAGEFSLRQSAYEIAPVTAVGGTIRLKDELKFSFDIAAREQG
ncbi:MAG TPA: YceI family protein [Verrucomicrobiae bacterium]|nr:YceI family protein [Verrucomicrobiae bacterium]